MEKQLKLKSKILKILPKAVTTVTLTFQNPPFSPGRDHKSKQKDNATRWVKPHGGKGFSGPIGSIIPREARRKPNDKGTAIGLDYQEPTSPKISCMGQIKHRKEKVKKAKARNVASNTSSSNSRDIEVKKHVTTFRRMLFHVGKQKSSEGRRKSDASAPHDNKYALEEGAPHVSQMKRFASGRDTFANFDWKAQVVPEEIDYYSDEERVQSDSEEEDEVIIPFSAPLLVGGGGGVARGSVLDLKPRKEINLWKRRTMAPPRPLQLDPVQ